MPPFLQYFWRPQERRALEPICAVVYATAALIGLGLLMTFPTFFQAFAPD
jgi:hypothetical protein